MFLILIVLANLLEYSNSQICLHEGTPDLLYCGITYFYMGICSETQIIYKDIWSYNSDMEYQKNTLKFDSLGGFIEEEGPKGLECRQFTLKQLTEQGKTYTVTRADQQFGLIMSSKPDLIICQELILWIQSGGYSPSNFYWYSKPIRIPKITILYIENTISEHDDYVIHKSENKCIDIPENKINGETRSLVGDISQSYSSLYQDSNLPFEVPDILICSNLGLGIDMYLFLSSTSDSGFIYASQGTGQFQFIRFSRNGEFLDKIDSKAELMENCYNKSLQDLKNEGKTKNLYKKTFCPQKYLHITKIQSMNSRQDSDPRQQITIEVTDQNKSYNITSGICFFDVEVDNCNTDLKIPYSESNIITLKLIEKAIGDNQDNVFGSNLIHKENQDNSLVEIIINTNDKFNVFFTLKNQELCEASCGDQQENCSSCSVDGVYQYKKDEDKCQPNLKYYQKYLHIHELRLSGNSQDIDERDEILLYVFKENYSLNITSGLHIFDKKQDKNHVLLDLKIPYYDGEKITVHLTEVDVNIGQDKDEEGEQIIGDEDIEKGYIQIGIENHNQEYSIDKCENEQVSVSSCTGELVMPVQFCIELSKGRETCYGSSVGENTATYTLKFKLVNGYLPNPTCGEQKDICTPCFVNQEEQHHYENSCIPKKIDNNDTGTQPTDPSIHVEEDDFPIFQIVGITIAVLKEEQKKEKEEGKNQKDQENN